MSEVWRNGSAWLFPWETWSVIYMWFEENAVCPWADTTGLQLVSKDILLTYQSFMRKFLAVREILKKSCPEGGCTPPPPPAPFPHYGRKVNGESIHQFFRCRTTHIRHGRFSLATLWRIYTSWSDSRKSVEKIKTCSYSDQVVFSGKTYTIELAFFLSYIAKICVLFLTIISCSMA